MDCLSFCIYSLNQFWMFLGKFDHKLAESTGVGFQILREDIVSHSRSPFTALSSQPRRENFSSLSADTRVWCVCSCSQSALLLRVQGLQLHVVVSVSISEATSALVVQQNSPRFPGFLLISLERYSSTFKFTVLFPVTPSFLASEDFPFLLGP